MDRDARTPPEPVPGDEKSRGDYDEIIESLAVIRLQSWLLRRQFDREQMDEQSLLARLQDIDRQTRVIDTILTRAGERHPDPSDER